MSNIKLFESKKVRSLWNDDEQKWYFSIIDIVEILTDTDNPRRYWSDLKRKLKKEGFIQLYDFIVQLKMEASDGKKYLTDCANAEVLLRIIQTIPSQKAEPFKRWLAQVGYERLEEIENPELATQRIRETYKMKGYSDDWIEKRMRGIAVRDELTDEWKKRGLKEQREYSILTAEISRATFGMTPSEYKKFKELSKPTDNLRDHMTDLELIFTMLGEASTTEISRKRDAQGFLENLTAAHEGGTVAGNARKELESKTGTKVVTKENYKELTEGKKRKQLKDKQ
ncbi:BRO-N domain-containing protein [Desulfitibacter alkalitolerans]|uniref:BRO-N domain-containing protein n=1 Tax=Desulfitibacter alkalitolerans TaxID=264641 RepID=UPI000557252E|nr:Bro-N domain-containing protein [Desulfitibacter alkalitolerans]